MVSVAPRSADDQERRARAGLTAGMVTVIRAAEYGGPDVLQVLDEAVPPPGRGEVTIAVRASGVNPADYKGFSGAMGADRSRLPLPVGSEVAGVLTAVGPDTEIASGGGALGDEVLAYRIEGGYAGAVTVAADSVFAKPERLSFPEAANLMLVGATAADMLRVVPVSEGDTVVVHGASGAVGVSLLQQLRLAGVRAVGTASEARFEEVARFGGLPVRYGEGLLDRVRELVPDGVAAAFDCVGTDEAVDVSLAVVEPPRLVSIAAFGRAEAEGFHVVGGATPDSAVFRREVRPRLIALAASGDLVVPVARTWPLEQAATALAFLRDGHPGGKLALVP